MGDLEGKTINIKIIGGSLNKGECEETHEIGRKKVFENILEPSKSIFFQERALNWGGWGGSNGPLLMNSRRGWGGCMLIIHS